MGLVHKKLLKLKIKLYLILQIKLKKNVKKTFLLLKRNNFFWKNNK